MAHSNGKRGCATFRPLKCERDCDVAKILYTIKETERDYGLGVTRIYELLGAKKLKAHKDGSKTLITAASLKKWAQSLPEGKFVTREKERKGARPAQDEEAGSAA